MRFLNARERKRLIELLREQYGFDKRPDYVFLLSEKNRIYIINSEIRRLDFDRLNVNTIGLYFGEVHDNEIRLSIEGSQIVGPHADRNVIEVNAKDAREWMRGEDIHYDYPSKKFVIIRCGNDYMGCGRAKGNRILNHVPKTRRIRSID